jgi:hypothetical protein
MDPQIVAREHAFVILIYNLTLWYFYGIILIVVFEPSVFDCLIRIFYLFIDFLTALNLRPHPVAYLV